MKNNILVVTACAVMLLVSSTAYGEVVSNQRLAIEGWWWWDPCNMESVEVFGEYHELVDIACAEGECTVKYHVNAHGKGKGVDSGKEYVFNDSYSYTETYSEVSFSGVFYFRTRLVTKGGASNSQLLFKVKYAFDPVNGYRDEVLRDEMICSGCQ